MLLMGRRHFITLLGGALADHAIPANAQEPVRVRTIGARRDFITLLGGAATCGSCATASHFPAISTRMCISLF
jgi:hypothetical protein